jgi:lysophospholipase L1-like esterase
MTDVRDRPSGHDELDHPRRGPRPRQRVRWTYALGVSVLAFLLWLLVDAPTLQHNAQVSPVGVRRTVSLDILGPLAAISRGLQLSHIVSVADGVLGRNGNRPGNGTSVIVSRGPTGTHPVAVGPVQLPSLVPKSATTTTAPLNTRPSAAAPLRVLVVGDSLGIDLGNTLVNDLAGTGVVSATLDGEEATGLTRPDYYNWPSELQGDLAKYSPQVVVIMVGANDPQDFPGPPDVPFGTAQWSAMYTQRVGAFMQEATSSGARVIWVGMPPMQDGGRSSAMQTLDGIYQSQAQQIPGVTYVDGWALLSSPPGQYAAYLVSNGVEVNVREPDGTHVSPGGAEILSQAVMSTMRTQLHIVLPG